MFFIRIILKLIKERYKKTLKNSLYLCVISLTIARLYGHMDFFVYFDAVCIITAIVFLSEIDIKGHGLYRFLFLYNHFKSVYNEEKQKILSQDLDDCKQLLRSTTEDSSSLLIPAQKIQEPPEELLKPC